MRRRKLATDDSGAVIVESALVLPVLLLVVFGILEFGFLYRDYLLISDGTADASRIGSIVGPDTRQRGGEFVPADFLMLERMRNSAGTLDPRAFDRIVFFRSGPPAFGSAEQQIPTACKEGTGGVAGVCNVYDDPIEAFRAIETGDADYFDCTATPSSPACSWPAATWNDGPNPSQIDYLGVWVRVNHDFVTGFFGQEMDLTSGVITRLEPGSSVR